MNWVDSFVLKTMSNESGSGKGYPSQDRSLKKTKREVKQLEKSLHKETKKNEKLQKENDRLKKENEKLKKELGAKRKTPKWAKANKSDAAKRAAKKKGPKHGHTPHPRRKPKQIDFEVKLAPKNCPHCEGDLPEPHKWHSHIQVELPAFLKPFVTRFKIGWCYCRKCKKEVSTKQRVLNSKYGARLHALVVYWKFNLGLTLGKIQKSLNDQYGLKLSTGQISELIARSGREFNDYYDAIGTSLRDQSFLHADESGWRVDGNNAWLWSYSNPDLTYYDINQSRGSRVVEEILGQSYGGVLVSDFYAAYNAIDSKKQKCWTHLLRELRELKEKFPKNTEIQYFSSRLKAFFARGNQLKIDFDQGQDIDRRLKRLESETQNWAFKKHRHAELKRVAKRMVKFRDQLYTFVKSPGVDATNNLAEREQRPAVLLRKISYGNRSSDGAKHQAILMSSIRTIEKQGQNFVDTATRHLTQ